MSKIVQAVNTMVANPNLITNVAKGREEYFFRYGNKYTWSIKDQGNGDVSLWFYPSIHDVGTLLELEESSAWEEVAMVHYNTGDLGTKEAKASFRELATVVKERLFSVNEALDDIISGGEQSG